MRNPSPIIEWRFKPNSKDDKCVDPIQGEFFTTSDVGNISNALIREGIQNALDARLKSENQGVRVRVFLSGDTYSIPPEKYFPLIETLAPHLRAKNNGLNDLPDFKRPMRYLVFEDFNTEGLLGDPNEYFVQNINDRLTHNYYYFWRNVGRSGKSDDQLGRWGLGKTVFPACSEINAFWGLTIRCDDKKKLLMGQCVLRNHSREDRKDAYCGFRPYGDYGKYIDDKDSTGEKYFAYPAEEDDLATINFESLFKIERKNESGLSIIIPFYSDELSLNHLVYSVVEQYFYPILEGKLEVEIVEEDKVKTLTKDKIQSTVDEIDYEELSRSYRKFRSAKSLKALFELANWTLKLKDEEYFRLNAPDLKLKPRWTKNLFPDEDTLAKLRDDFEAGNRIAVKVPLKYSPKGERPSICWYNAFIEKDFDLQKPETLLVRDGITISGINLLDKGAVRGMVVIQDPHLARMLGDSENPAHTEWNSESRNFKGKYENGSEAIKFVTNTLVRLFEKLQKPLEGLDKDILIDFFSIPIQTEDQETGGQKTRSKGEKTSGEEIPKIIRKEPALLADRISGGFRIYNNPKVDTLPESAGFKLAYDVPRGNPIKSYQPADFDLAEKRNNPIQIKYKGVNITRREKNILEFDIVDKSDIEIVLTGFDVKRDLFIKLN
jgi:hypothetical protein